MNIPIIPRDPYAHYVHYAHYADAGGKTPLVINNYLPLNDMNTAYKSGKLIKSDTLFLIS